MHKYFDYILTEKIWTVSYTRNTVSIFMYCTSQAETMWERRAIANSTWCALPDVWSCLVNSDVAAVTDAHCCIVLTQIRQTLFDIPRPCVKLCSPLRKQAYVQKIQWVESNFHVCKNQLHILVYQHTYKKYRCKCVLLTVYIILAKIYITCDTKIHILAIWHITITLTANIKICQCSPYLENTAMIYDNIKTFHVWLYLPFTQCTLCVNH